jgi:hypothetical protein
MPQEAKALGNARDKLTWGGCKGRHRYRKVMGLMAGVFDVLKTAEFISAELTDSGVKPRQW